jgi:hypothetical protein
LRRGRFRLLGHSFCSHTAPNSGTRVDVSRNHSIQDDATIPGSPATGLRRWGGESGDPEQNSTGHCYSGSALIPAPSRAVGTGPSTARRRDAVLKR